MSEEPFSLRTRLKVLGVHEHIRTIRGRKDGLGNAVLDSVSLGWFVHTDLDEGGISFCVGPQRPGGVEAGDTLLLTLRKE